MVNVIEDPALTLAEVPPGVGEADILRLRFTEEVPMYTATILALLVPTFLMTTLMVDVLGHETFSFTSNTPVCCVFDPVKVISQAYVTITAATAMNISRSVARIGEILFSDSNVFKSEFISVAQTFWS